MAPAGQAPNEWAQAYHCGGSAADLGLRLLDSTCSIVEWAGEGYGIRAGLKLGVMVMPV